MLKRVRVPLQRFLAPIGTALAARGVNPNVITVVGTAAVTAVALVFYPRGQLFWGSLIIGALVCFDMLDGALARAAGRTGPWGAFLDSTMDRIADAAIFAGLTWWFTHGGRQPVLAGLTLFCLVTAMLISYARARAEGLGLRGDVGIAERTERLIVVLVATGVNGLGVPYVAAIGLWLLAVASAVTVVQRFVAVYRQTRASLGTPAGVAAPADHPASAGPPPADRAAPAGAASEPAVRASPHRLRLFVR
jgi:CDP-diacylglycerol--glycerol-3-phosphate 3-phosphatidyltransferase